MTTAEKSNRGRRGARAFRTLAVAVVAAGLATAAIWTIRVAWADLWAGQETVAGTERALRLTPEQSAYYGRLAALVSEEDPARAVQALEKAVALNPADAQSWIQLGLRFEAQGNRATAEKCLLRAAEEDKQYLPAWTLANYYFRQGELAPFWTWAKRSAQMLYGDPVPLFRLCGRLQEDGHLIERLDLRPAGVRAAYVGYLLAQGRSDVIQPAVERLIESGRKADVPLALQVCDRFIAENRGASAVAVWNRLAGARLIPFPAVSAAGPNLTNGNFSTEPSSRGFDWRLPEVAGISAAAEEKGGIRLTFSGRQPESCEPLMQYLPVLERARYELRFAYRTSGIAPGTGLHWRLTDAAAGRILAEGDSLSSDDEAQGRVPFSTVAGTQLVQLALTYKRATGTTRIEGYITLKGLEAGPADHSEGPSRSRVTK